MTVSAGAAVEADADAELRAALARVVQANERWERLAAQLREENAALRAENERLRAENERVSAELAVLQRLVFAVRRSEPGRSLRQTTRTRLDLGMPRASGSRMTDRGGVRVPGRVVGITRTCRGWK